MIVSLHHPRHPFVGGAATPLLWTLPQPIQPAPLRRHGAATGQAFRLLQPLLTTGLPKFCQQNTTLSFSLTDRLLAACHPLNPPLRRPFIWCAGLLRLMADKLDSKIRLYNATLPPLCASLSLSLSSSQLQSDDVPALVAQISDCVCSFGAFLKDVHVFFQEVDSELRASEALVAALVRRRRMRRVGFVLLFVILVAAVIYKGQFAAIYKGQSYFWRR